MRFKKALLLLIIVFFILTIIFGCRIKEQEAIKKTSEITDTAELELLWQNYLYDTIYTIGNNGGFNSPEEIEPIYVARYCFHKYIAEHGPESLELVEQTRFSRFFPLDKVLEYAKKYFNLTSLDLSEISKDEYNPEKQAFIFSTRKEKIPSYTDKNPFGMYLDKVTKNEDGTITAVLVRYSSYQPELVELTDTYTLKKREDGSMYFVNGKREYINNHLVKIKGKFNHFDKISGFKGNIEELSMIGEIDKNIILVYTPYDIRKKASLMLVNPDTLSVKKQIELNDSIRYQDVKFIDNKIVVLLKEKVITFNTKLEELENISLPKVITEKIKRKPVLDVKGAPNVFFGGYDVTNDMTKFVYCDEIGVKLYDTVNKTEKLLARTVDKKDTELIDNIYHKYPRFIDQNKKVITTMTGYECTLGYTLCDLEKGTTKRINLVTDTSYPNLIRYDTGILMVNIYIKEKQKGEYKTLYLDFHTGELKEIKLDDPGDTGYIIDEKYCFVGKNYAAFITYNHDSKNNANNMYYINRLNLNTLKLEPKIVSVKIAQTSILGVLNDGRILFKYNLNASEKGVCITK